MRPVALNNHKPPLAIFLYELSGKSAGPFLEMGWECICVDIAHESDRSETRAPGTINFIKADARNWSPTPDQKERCQFFAAFPPCDHLAVSGARWFKGKGLRKLSSSIELFAVAAEMADELAAPYFIENPISTISSYWRKPDHKFHPYHFADWEPRDNYSKQTCLWVGNGFKMPWPSYPEGLQIDTKRIVNASENEDRKNLRSETPVGFMKAVYEANFLQ
ncbi:hypothetical protein CFBP4996_15405 [Agrobacterium leguminum]|uniref:hypothetical protein n=1 Tax=Agrobacterium TaxID=357 RepID=UPI0019698C62|nr:MULTISPECIES: hypothetical protein [Agrobacterium]WFS67414.1 hypothetical protein CFBP4996_15405 [Agrobacterium leguminum]